jgi:hypothetical protein
VPSLFPRGYRGPVEIIEGRRVGAEGLGEALSLEDPTPDPEKKALGSALVGLGRRGPKGLLQRQARREECGEVARHKGAFKGG